jgi:DNA repair protein RadA/Sms
MARIKSVFVCQQCGYKSSKWIGKCPSCSSWNSFIEEVESVDKTSAKSAVLAPGSIKKLQDVSHQSNDRMLVPYAEFNRVLGGGIVPGSLILLGGEPGIGKSTLILQTALGLVGRSILYVSGEESPEQIKMRANRVSNTQSECYLLSEINVHKILEGIKELKPDLVVIDSIQTMYSDELSSGPGTVSQVRACTQYFQEYAKKHHLPFLLIGHINKDGNIAGPMALEHIVDVVLQFEGDSNHQFRLLRGKKNRFGSTAEIGVFEMSGEGLNEIKDPGMLLLPQGSSEMSGIALAAMNEGARTLMLEVQSLASSSVYSSPQRITTGFDLRRLHMLLAVVEKRLGVRLGQKDIFLNIAGGIRVSDPGVDLAVIASILSSTFDKTIHRNVCFMGEVSLSGQVRPVSNIDQRLSEVKRLGFTKAFVSKYQKTSQKSVEGFKIEKIEKVNDLSPKLFT